MKFPVLLFLTITIGAAVSAKSQTATPSPTPPAVAANLADVATVDATITAVYDVISGPAGTRNWDRFRSLFIPGARLIPTSVSKTGEAGSRVLSVEDYIQRAGANFEKQAFYERQVSFRMERFGNIAHVFSTYESRRGKDDPKPFVRGINSIQLMNDGKRWWIVTIFWQGEDEKNPLPAEYLRTRN